MLWKLLKETNQGHKPTHLAVIFDYSSKTFRNDSTRNTRPTGPNHRPTSVRSSA